MDIEGFWGFGVCSLFRDIEAERTSQGDKTEQIFSSIMNMIVSSPKEDYNAIGKVNWDPITSLWRTLGFRKMAKRKFRIGRGYQGSRPHNRKHMFA
jgi:hypothetical protein